MVDNNPCKECIGRDGQGEDCCIDVYIILNPEEIYLFKDKNGYVQYKEEGGVFYTEEGCPYLSVDNQCLIHDKKPLYCKYYPIFITGKPYVDQECPANTISSFTLTKDILKEIQQLQEKFPIYRSEWTWLDVREFFLP